MNDHMLLSISKKRSYPLKSSITNTKVIFEYVFHGDMVDGIKRSTEVKED